MCVCEYTYELVCIGVCNSEWEIAYVFESWDVCTHVSFACVCEMTCPCELAHVYLHIHECACLFMCECARVCVQLCPRMLTYVHVYTTIDNGLYG